MTGRIFKIEGWEASNDPMPEEARTFSRLSIFGQERSPASRVLDKRAQTTRDFLYVSAYPLAEWLVSNYWALTAIHGSSTGTPNVIAAGAGYLLPDLSWRGLGEMVELVWRARDLADQPLDFLGHGRAMLSLGDVEKDIASLVGQVISRLGDGEGLALREEWAAVRQSLSNTEETFWCRIVASLGLDPYALDEETRKTLEAASEALRDPELLRQLAPACQSVDQFVTKAGLAAKLVDSARTGEAVGLAAVKEELSRPVGGLKMYERGYALARNFREVTSAPMTFASYENLRTWLNTLAESEDWIVDEELDNVIYGAVVSKGSRGPGLAVAKSAKNERMMFAIARGIGEYFDKPKGPIKSILSRAETVKSRVGRAFAAELLAPMEGIREQISGSEISGQQIASIAEGFGVEDMIVRHQVRNHHLAEVTD